MLLELQDFLGRMGGTRVGGHHGRTTFRNAFGGRRQDATRLVALGLQPLGEQQEPARNGHGHHGFGVAVAAADTGLVVLAAGRILDGEFAMAFREADGDIVPSQDLEDPQRDLVLVDALHHQAAAFRLDHRGVVETHTVGLGEAGLLVGVDGANVQAGIAPPHQFHDLLHAAAVLVPGLVEPREIHVGIEVVGDLESGFRRREHLLAGQVEMGVVADQGGVRDEEHRGCGDDRARGAQPRRPTGQRGLQGQPQAGEEHHEQGHQPSGEPEQLSRFDVVHGQRRSRARRLTNKPNSVSAIKNPRSDRYMAPVAKGVK